MRLITIKCDLRIFNKLEKEKAEFMMDKEIKTEN